MNELAANDRPHLRGPARTPPGSHVRNRAVAAFFAPRWVTSGVAVGLFALAASLLILVWALGTRVTTEVLAHHGMRVERQLEETVHEVAAEEFGEAGDGLATFSQRILTVARHSPVLRELVVVAPDRQVVHSFGTDELRPCLAAVPPDRGSNLEHRAGDLGRDRVGCLVVPVRVERVEALGSLASGINHEIKNPPNALGLCLQILKRRHADEESIETLAMAEDRTRRNVSTLDEFARFVRVTELRLEDVDVGASALRVAQVRGWTWRWRRCSNCRPRHRTQGTPLQVAVGGTRQAWTGTAAVAAPGFEAATLAHIFDPYVRPEPLDVGRGLAWARAVFQAHGGDVGADYQGDRLEMCAHAATSPGE